MREVLLVEKTDFNNVYYVLVHKDGRFYFDMVLGSFASVPLD